MAYVSSIQTLTDFFRNPERRRWIYQRARKNGTYNEKGELCISKDDPWMQGGPVFTRDEESEAREPWALEN